MTLNRSRRIRPRYRSPDRSHRAAADRSDLLSGVRQSQRSSPQLYEYLAAHGWYRDRGGYVASRYPILSESCPLSCPRNTPRTASVTSANVVRVKDPGVPKGDRVRAGLGPHADAPVRSLPVPGAGHRGPEETFRLVGRTGRTAARRAGRDARHSPPDPGAISTSLPTTRRWPRWAHSSASLTRMRDGVMAIRDPRATLGSGSTTSSPVPNGSSRRCRVGPDVGSDHLPRDCRGRTAGPGRGSSSDPASGAAPGAIGE